MEIKDDPKDEPAEEPEVKAANVEPATEEKEEEIKVDKEDEPKGDGSKEEKDEGEKPDSEQEQDPEVTTGSEISTDALSQAKEEMNDPNWENKYELLDYVMSFLETAEDLNDVLAGYFSKLINMLTNK